MADKLSPNAHKVQNALNQHGLSINVVELPVSTRTAVEAAQAIGCQVDQIVKSLIFNAKRTNRPVLVLASGANRVDERKVEALIHEPLGKADADYVINVSGFRIGGVPPIGHISHLETFIDEDLLQNDSVWAAAGTPHAVFRITPANLLKITNGRVVDVKV
ncbi:MAG: YbaK/EbsC family protein [Chloroflexota bacterium]|nr:YbaK/EbsC family protein [Chloroflexota bacterium]